MIKSKINNSRGVSLVSLSITIVILVLITNILIYNVKDNLKVGNLRNMQNDISNLKDKVSSYYAQNGKIPAQIKYTNVEHIREAGLISEAVDTGDFYIIDLSALENLTLNYGEDYKNITADLTEQQINEFLDLYIINETSHNIFYVEGIKVDNDIFYTNYAKEDVDVKSVDLRYIENVKIPDGFSYVSGTKDTGIHIKSNDGNSEYIWIPQNDKIESIASDIEVDNEEAFIESVNIYKGYYKNTNDNTVVYLELEEKWTPAYDKSSIYKDKNNNIVSVPEGFQVCITPGKNTVDDGLIIKNEQTDDRYVWIEVPKSIYQTAGSEIDYENIEKDMKNYTASYREGFEDWTDKWYAFDGDILITEDTENLTDEQKELTNGCGLTYDEYIELRNEMYSSIYNNGGFWIGQYEVGSSDYVTANDNSSRTSVIKEGAYPYNYVTCAQAQKLATQMPSGDKKSSLMFGIQWDLVLKFIESKSDKTQADIKTDSSDWGNYYFSTFKIDRGKYYVKNDDQSWSWIEYSNNTTNYVSNQERLKGKYVLLTTGAAEQNKVLNIYDFAGNAWEWTLEHSEYTDKISCIRGGSANSWEDHGSSSYRLETLQTDNNSSYGFRVALY